MFNSLIRGYKWLDSVLDRLVVRKNLTVLSLESNSTGAEAIGLFDLGSFFFQV